MKLGKSTDTSGASDVYGISNRLELMFPEIECEFPGVELEIFFMFRCLPDELGRKTSRRYSKSENVLYLDISFSEDAFSAMTAKEQEVAVATVLFDYLEESLNKYKFKGLDVSNFLGKFKEVARARRWGIDDWDV